MNSLPIENLIALVSRRTGLHIREEEYDTFGDKIQGRLTALDILDLTGYHNMLETQTPEAAAEWSELASLLTTGESYFFRNKDQITLLKNRILPELIASRRDKRQLRIWSAGCSTGEEPYSLAILLDELLPPLNDWQILVLGTDINEKAVAKARTGIYTQWSFRMVPSELRDRYFTRHKGDWKILDSIRNKVTFRQCNLVEDVFPSLSGEMREIDLILCRNVFIYFAPETISFVASKFAESLNEGGYLVTGYGELPTRNLTKINTRIFDDQVVFQKESHRDQFAPVTIKTSIPNADRWRTAPDLLPAETYFGTHDRRNKSRLSLENLRKPVSGTTPFIQRVHNGRETPVSPRSSGSTSDMAQTKVSKSDSHNEFETHFQQAQSRANAGDYEQAILDCRKALHLAPTSPTPYFLLAQIDEAKGNTERAKDSFKKVIYLDPYFVAAHLELSKICLRENDHKQARKLLCAAQELLITIPPLAGIATYSGMTTAELLRHVDDMLLATGGK